MNEIDVTTDLAEKILRKKQELNAVILAHYYQESEIQDIADFVGIVLNLRGELKKQNQK